MSFLGRALGSCRFRLREFSFSSFVQGSKKKCITSLSFVKSGVIHEFMQARRHFTHLPSTRYFIELTQKITTVANRSLSYFRKKGEVETAVSAELSQRLAAVADGRFEPPPSEQQPIAPIEERIEALSLLNYVEGEPCISTLEDLTAVKTLSATTAELLVSEEFLEFLPQEYRPVMARQQAFFQKARDCQQEIVRIAAEGEIDYATAKPKMQEKSRQLAEEIARLEMGETLPLYVPLASGKDTLIKHVVGGLGRHFFEKNQSFDLDAIKLTLLNTIRQKFTELEVEGKYAGLLEKFAHLQASVLGDNPGRIKQAVLGSVAHDLMTLLQEYGEKVHLPEEVWNHFRDLPQYLHTKLEAQLQRGFSKIEEKVDLLNLQIGKMIPGPLQNLLAENDLYVSPQFAYFMITKREGSYDLVVYPSKQDPSFYLSDLYGVDSPLVYHHVDPTKLNEDFFYRALTYQAFLSEQGVTSFNLRHLKEGLLDTFLDEPSGLVNAVPRDFKNPTLSSLELTLMQNALHKSVPQVSLNSIQRALVKGTIDWKFNQLLKSWSYFYHHRESRSAITQIRVISSAVEKLAKELREVEGKGLYSDQEFREYSATLCHASATLEKIKQEERHRIGNNPEKKVAAPLYIPEELRRKIEEICLTEGSIQGIEMVRSLFLDFFGEDVDETMEQVITELFPYLESGQKKRDHSSGSILEALGFHSVWGEESIAQIKNRQVAFSERASLLSTYRLFASLCDFCNHTVVGAISEIIVKVTLLYLFPGVGISAYLVKTLLDKASLHGPGVIRAAFPKWIADPLVAFLTIYNEVTGYIRRRIAMSVMRAGFHAIFKEHKESLKRILLDHVAIHTREGTLDFNLPIQSAPLVTLQAPVLPISSAPQEVSQAVSSTVEQEKDPLEIHLLSNLAESSAAYDKLTNEIKVHLDKKTFSADLFIAYFRVAATMHHQAQRIFSPWKDFAELLPVPDFLFFERWSLSQGRNLTDIQKEEIALLLEYFKTTVRSKEAIWNPKKLNDAFEWTGRASVNFVELWNFKVRLSCDEHLKRKIRINPFYDMTSKTTNSLSRIPEGLIDLKELALLRETDQDNTRVLNASLKKFMFQFINSFEYGHFLYDFASLQVEEEFTLQKKLFLGSMVITPSNVLEILHDACEWAHELYSRKMIFAKLKTVNQNGKTVNGHISERPSLLLLPIFRSLPIPPQKGPCPFWDEVENPAEVLQVLERLLRELAHDSDAGEMKLSSTAFYAIAFHLAKRIPECRIDEDVRLNGSNFLYYALNREYSYSTNIHFLGSSVDQVIKLLRYFRFTLEKDSRIFDSMSEAKLIKRVRGITRKTTRFVKPNVKMTDNLMNSIVCRIDTSTFNFYSQFKNDPIVLEKLRLLHPGYAWKEEGIRYIPLNESIDKVQKLMSRIPFRELDKNGSVIELFADLQLPNGERILPATLRALREIEARAVINSSAYMDLQKAIPISTFTERFFVVEKDSNHDSIFAKLGAQLFGPSREVRLHADRLRVFCDKPSEANDMEKFLKDNHSKMRKRPELQQDLADIFRYRTEEFLRIIGCLKIDPIFYLDLLFPYINYDYLSMTLLLVENPHLEVIIADIFEIIGKLSVGSQTQKSADDREIQWLCNLALLAAKYSDLQQGRERQNMTVFVREQIRERIHEHGCLIKSLIASYADENNLFLLDEQEQRESLADIAMGWTEFGLGELNALVEAVFVNWKPYLIQRLNRDPEFLKMVMNRLFRGSPSEGEAGEMWSGFYPVFTNGEITVNMDEMHRSLNTSILEYRKGHYFDLKRPLEVSGKAIPAPLENEIVSPEIKIDLERHAHGLGILSWFQPLKDIEAFADRNEPEKIKKIVFLKVQGLSFDVVEKEGKLRAYNNGVYPGYFIAEKQKIPSLNPYGQYLLLENDRGEKKVLLLPLSQYQMAANVLAKIGPKITLTAGISKFIPSGEEKEIVPIDCDLDATGRLVSKNQEGSAYLFAFHFIQEDEALAETYLQDLEALGRRMEFSRTTQRILDQVALRPLLSSKESDQKFGLRMVSMIYENRSIYTDRKNWVLKAMEERVCLWVLGQKSLLFFKKKKLPLPINEYAELNLLNALTYESSSLASNQFSYSYAKYLEKVQGFLLHPSLSKRYAKLRMIHFREAKSFFHYGVASALKAWSARPSSGLSQSISSAASSATAGPNSESQGRGVMLYAFDLLRRVRKFSIQDTDSFGKVIYEAFQKFDYNADLVNVPVKYSEISYREVTRYFCLYLTLLIGVPPSTETDQAKLALFEQKSETFKKSLRLLKGNFKNELVSLIQMLHIIGEQPRLLDRFTFDSTSKECKDGCFVDKLMDYCSRLEKEKTLISTKDLLVLKDFILRFQLKGFFKKAVDVIQSDAVVDPAKKIALGIAKRVVPIPFMRQFADLKLLYDTGMSVLRKFEWGLNMIGKMVSIVSKNRARMKAGVAASERLNREIPLEFAQELKRRDESVDAVFDYLLGKFFTVSEVSAQSLTDEGEEGRVESRSLPLSDEEAVGSVFEELRQSHLDFHQRAAERRLSYAMTGDRELLLHELAEVRRKTIERIADERKQIELWVNRFKDEKSDRSGLTFDEVFSFILKGDDQGLIAKAGLDSATLAEIKLLVNLHLVAASRWDLVFQAHDKLMKGAGEDGLNAIATALATRRAYSFEGKQERVILGYLAFEARTGKVLWRKQAELFESMLLSPHLRKVLELIMGSGKTAFGMPLINFYASDGRQIAINIWPKATAPTNIEEISSQSKAVYNQNAWAFQFSRSDLSVPFLETFYVTLLRALEQKEQLNMTKEDLQALELNLIDLFDCKGEREHKKRKIELLCMILNFIEKHGKGNIDEAQVNFDQKTELNYPFGRKKTLPKGYCKTMEMVFVWLMDLSVDTLRPFKTPGEVLHQIEEAVFRETISPLLIEKAVTHFEIKPEDRPAFVSYMKNEGAEPEFLRRHPKYEEIYLSRGMCQVLLPFGFGTIPQVDYAISKEGKTLFARPAEGNDKPNEASSIQSPYESYIKTCILYLKNRLTENQVKEFISYLRRTAEARAIKHKIPRENTSAARYFVEMSGGADLFEMRGDEWPTVYERLKNSDPFTLGFVRRMAAPQIEYYPEKCSSNSHTLASMFHSFYSCTGTPDNSATYPENTIPLLDPGTQGECLALIRDKCQLIEGSTRIPSLQSTTADGLIDEVLHQFFFDAEEGYSCIIERGALFRGVANRAVATKMMQFAEEHRPDIKGVIFWNDQNEQMILEKGCSNPILLRHSNLLPHERLTYFDEAHTFAADIPQPVQAKGVVTFGEHTRLDGLFQAILRLRGLKTGQSFTFTTSQAVCRLIGKESITPDDVVAFAAQKSQAHRKRENFENAPKKMANILRAAVLKKIRHSPFHSKKIKLYQQFRELFVEKVEDNPVRLFGGLTGKGSPREALEAYRSTLERHVQSGLFTPDERAEISRRLDAAMQGEFPEQVTLHEGSGIDRSGLGQQIQTYQSSENQAESENQQTTENQIQRQQQQTVVIPKTSKPQNWYWDKDLDFYQLRNWLNVHAETTVPLHRVRDICPEMLKSLRSLLPFNILSTNNFTPVLDRSRAPTSFSPFLDPHQNRGYQAVLVQEQERRTWVLVDQKEANRIRNGLRLDRAKEETSPGREVKLALYDLDIDAFAAHGHDEGISALMAQMTTPELALETAQMKFLCGKLSYTEQQLKALKEWLSQADLLKVKHAYKKQLLNKYGSKVWKTRYYGSQIHNLFIQLGSGVGKS